MNAIAYLRLSVKDQSKSLEYQESTIENYCKNNDLKILKMFRDNGESSDTFDRTDYNELEAFLKNCKVKCDYLIVLDHDRFSRNLPQALMKIAELEKKYGVKVIACNEKIDLDTSDPDVFMKRAFDYMMANKELFTIRNRTKQGIRNAKENGRYLGRAPFGYRNIKEGAGKSIITSDPIQSKIIKKIFEDFLLGMPQYLIHRNAKYLGFKNAGKSAIRDVLSNCVYAGLIKIIAYKKEPEKYVKALHEPIVSEQDFWHVQQLLQNKRPQRSRATDDFPLRGLIRCSCGKKLTAGWSKGRRSYYLYYRCTGHANANISGNILHETFEQLLKCISFQPYQNEIIKKTVNSLIDEALQFDKDIRAEKVTTIKLLDRKIIRLEEKFIHDELDYATYSDWKAKFKIQKNELEIGQKAEIKPEIDCNNMLTGILKPDKNLHHIYERSSIVQKQAIIRSLFKDELTWTDGCFSTCFFNPAMVHNIEKIQNKHLLKINHTKD